MRFDNFANWFHCLRGSWLGVEPVAPALVRAHRALSEVPDDALRQLASTSARSADVVRIHRAIRDHLGARFSDEQDLVAAGGCDPDTDDRLRRAGQGTLGQGDLRRLDWGAAWRIRRGPLRAGPWQ